MVTLLSSSDLCVHLIGGGPCLPIFALIINMYNRGDTKPIRKITFEHFFSSQKISSLVTHVFLYYIYTVCDPSMQLDLFQIRINNPVVAEKFSVTVSVLPPPRPDRHAGMLPLSQPHANCSERESHVTPNPLEVPGEM